MGEQVVTPQQCNAQAGTWRNHDRGLPATKDKRLPLFAVRELQVWEVTPRVRNELMVVVEAIVLLRFESPATLEKCWSRYVLSIMLERFRWLVMHDTNLALLCGSRVSSSASAYTVYRGL
jgi:hypothetical protein